MQEAAEVGPRSWQDQLVTSKGPGPCSSRDTAESSDLAFNPDQTLLACLSIGHPQNPTVYMSSSSFFNFIKTY